MSRTFLAVVHYAGGAFAGWQRQPEERSVQAEFERVLKELCGTRIVAHAAGRTDAGVHAVGMGVSFTAPAKWTAESLHRALNALLAPDCWVASVHRMRPGFHARKSARERVYRYVVGTDSASRSPFRRPYEWPLARPLDLGALEAAAERILGEHDFSAFAAKGTPRPHYRCRVRVASWATRRDWPGVTLDIASDRFLHHMVRMLVGTMVDIGLARREVADMERLLASMDNQDTSPPAPPEGLYFVSADYAPDWFEHPAEV
jgi:tRNA pseudouridine38-40 synthase